MEGAPGPTAATPVTARIVRFADLAATFVFALEGGLVGLMAGLDPVGVLVLCFLGALGGGLIRDVLIGALPPAAIADWHYTVIVLVAAVCVWSFHALILNVPAPVVVALDAGGLALAAIAGTEKTLDRGIHPLVAVFLGTVSGTGGGALRDIVINQVPRVLRTDVYASAAYVAAVIVVTGRLAGWPPRSVAIAAGLACFGLRMTAYAYQWQLPTLAGAGV